MKWVKSLFVFIIVLSLSLVPGCSGDSVVNPDDNNNGSNNGGEEVQ